MDSFLCIYNTWNLRSIGVLDVDWGCSCSQGLERSGSCFPVPSIHAVEVAGVVRAILGTGGQGITSPGL